MIQIISPSRYKIGKRQMQKDVLAINERLGIPADADLNIIFVGRRKMREIASTYKHEDVALPVLAFPYKDVGEEAENLLGEIFICYPQAVLLAAEREKKVDVTMLQLLEHGIRNLLK